MLARRFVSSLCLGALSACARPAPVPLLRVSQAGVQSRLSMAISNAEEQPTTEMRSGLGGASAEDGSAEFGTERSDRLAQAASPKRFVQHVGPDASSARRRLFVGVATDQQQRQSR